MDHPVEPVAVPKISWRALFVYGGRLLRVCWGLALAFVVLSLAQQSALVVSGQLVGEITTRLAMLGGESGGADSGGLVSAYWFWLILAAGGLLISVPLRWVTEWVNGRMANRLRIDVFDNAIRQSPDFFQGRNAGELSTVINQFTQEAQMTMRALILEPVIQGIVLGLTVGLIIYNFVQIQGPDGIEMLGMRIPALLPPVIILILSLMSPYLTTKIQARVRRRSAELRDSNLALAGLVTGAMQSPEEIQAMNAEAVFGEKHEQALDGYVRARVRQSLVLEWATVLNGLPGWLAPAVLLGMAVAMAVNSPDSVEVGNVVAIFLLAPQLMRPVESLSGILLMAGSSWPGIHQVLTLLEQPPATGDDPQAREVETLVPTLEARAVTFAYPRADTPVFHDLSLTAPTGTITGLVGRMGQGKTTFFRLALRFYEPDEGAILLGGIDVRDIRLDSLRRHVGMMSQFPAFFHDTLRENLRLGGPDASDEELIAACRRTGLWDLLKERLGENPLDAPFAAGAMLSGGQRKLVALTRCLLRDPAFLFLDEPTAGMDNSEKYGLAEPLRRACAGKTVLTVDHDIPWLLNFCDHFIVLDGGRVIEEGSGAELLARDGIFAELHAHTHFAEPESGRGTGDGASGNPKNCC